MVCQIKIGLKLQKDSGKMKQLKNSCVKGDDGGDNDRCLRRRICLKSYAENQVLKILQPENYIYLWENVIVKNFQVEEALG